MLPEYTRNLMVAQAAALLTPMRRGIAISCWTYGIGVLLLALSPAGPVGNWAHATMIAVGCISLILGALWWIGHWPKAYVSLLFLVYSEVAHTGILLLTSSPMLALIATMWFALIGEHVTIAHGRTAVVVHCLWVLVNIVFFATRASQRTNANLTLIVYVAVALVGLIVAIPVLRQWSADALRNDSRRAAELAERDALTSLLNQRGMHAAVPGLLASGPPTDRQLAVVVIDLDRFKAINDRYGHHGGDRVLTLVAGRLSASVRRGAIVARTGGEEFVVIDTVGPDGSGKLAHRLVSAIYWRDDDIPVTASIGVASTPLGDVAIADLTQSIQDLIAQADRMMYDAKRDGGNGVRVFDPRSKRAT
jgi:diguanylate cyclase (GGDEF)-like protein